jgi:hypothetical protein
MQDFFKQQEEWLKTWQEIQETLTKQYAGWSEEWMANMHNDKDKAPEFFHGWFKSQSDLEQQFREFSKRLNEMIYNVWSDKVPADVLKFMSISFFEEFYKNWLSSLELPEGVKNSLGTDGGWQKATDFLQSFLKKDHPFFSTFSNTNITDQMNGIFGMMQGALGQKEGPFGTIVSDYQDFFSKMFESTATQSTEKLAEGFEAWAKEMEKHLSAPKLGINRELAHDMSQLLVMSQDYVQTYIKMMRLVEATGRKAGTRFLTKLSESAIKNKPVNKFTDLCALWSVENETVFLEVMGSQEFAKLQGDFVDAGNRLKIQWNKLAERVLEPTPIALKRDLDLAIAEITQLKRDMRTFQRLVREQGKDTLAVGEAQAAAEEEAKKAKTAEAAARAEAKKAKTAEAAALAETEKVKTAEAAALAEAKKAKTAEAAALAEAKKAKTAEAAALAEAKKAKTAEAAALAEAEKAKTAEAAAHDEAKRINNDKRTVKAATEATTKTKPKNV